VIGIANSENRTKMNPPALRTASSPRPRKLPPNRELLSFGMQRHRERAKRVGRLRLPALLPLMALAALLTLGGALRAEEEGLPRILSFAVTPVQAPPSTEAGYETTRIDFEDGAVEHRCLFRGWHFLSVLRDPHGAFAVRAHPGVDVNGWGTTVYLHPYLSGVALTGSTISGVVAGGDGVAISASGGLRNAAEVLKGAWTVSLHMSFDPDLKKVSGSGSLGIALTQPLTAGEDIDVVKIASNYLHQVPLLTGGIGDTGDTTGAFYSGSALASQFWDPVAQPGHFPQDQNDWIDVTLPGRHNLVDSARQLDPNHPGQYQEPIAAAYKPATRLRLELAQAGQVVPFQFGASFDQAFATDFAADNVSVTPQIRHFTPVGQLDFALVFESEALPDEKNWFDATLAVAHEDTAPTMAAQFSPSMLPGTWGRIASLKRREDGSYSATFKFPSGARGFFRAVAEEEE
jgi:hypothetical protein